MNLRPYQNQALLAVKNRTVNRGIVAMATGCGKGHIAGDLMDALGTEKVLYLAHREELISQLAGHVERRVGFMNVDIEQAGSIAGGARSVVASVPTLAASDCKRLKRLGDNRFEAIVCDEAHHATAESYLKIWQYFGILDENKKKVSTPHLPLIGLTATPSRGDGVGLNNVFDEILYQYSLTQAINDGWLCPVYAWTIKTGVSLDGIKTRMGDYSEKELSERCATDERNAMIFKAHQDYAAAKKTLIFCIDIDHAEQVAAHFSDNGKPANHVSGKMSGDERASVLRWFAKTPGAVLTNCQLITEGVDIPSVECVIMARPTKSKTFYAQCLSEDTEVLTRRGFVGPDEWRPEDEVASFDLSSGEIVFERAENKVDRTLGPDQMYEYDTKMASLCITGGHRMVYRLREGRARNWSSWKIETAATLAVRSDSYAIPVSGHYHAPGIPLEDYEIDFLAWSLTDGYFNKSNGAIYITQNSGHEMGIRSIETTLQACGFKYGREAIASETNFGPRTSPLYRYSISRGQPRGRDKHLSGWGRLEPWRSLEALSQMDEKQFDRFLFVVNLADGSKQHKPYVSHGDTWTRRSLTITKTRKFIEWLQGMAAVRGYRTVSNGNGNCWHVNLKKQEAIYVGGASAKDRDSLHEVPSNPDERVWCLTTRLGTLLTRRAGRVAIVGNCLGRGTRLAKGAADFTQSIKLGKDRVILLDITDSTKDLGRRAVNIADIFGAPIPLKPFKGENVVAETEKQEEILNAAKHGGRLPDGAEYVAAAFDLFAAPADIDGAEMAWLDYGDTYRLQLAKHGEITVQSDALDRWAALYFNPETNTTVSICGGEATDKSAIIRTVEAWVNRYHPDVMVLLDRNAKWRHERPSRQQLDLCHRMRIYPPEGATKGQVSMMISRRFGSKAAAGVRHG